MPTKFTSLIKKSVALVCLFVCGCAVNKRNLRASWDFKKQESPHYQIIRNILSSGNSVKVCIIADDYSEVMYKNFYGEMESNLFNSFGKFKGFEIVDRTIVEKLMKEQLFQITGATENSVKIGKMAGVTHVLYWYVTDKYPSHVKTTKLIEVETGRILSSAWAEWW